LDVRALVRTLWEVTKSTGNDGHRIIASLDHNPEINSDIFNSKGAGWSEVYYRLQQV
jgi:hypothetical protein